MPIPHITIYQNAIPVSPLALGTADYGTNINESIAFALMDHYYEHGGNCFDSALIYGAWEPGKEGASESVLGKWIKANNLRKDCFIVTKGCHPDLANEQIPRVSKEAIDEDIQKSLTNLQSDYIDLYLLHRDNPKTPVGEILQWLETAKENGYIRSYGCSNWSASRLQEASTVSQNLGYTGFQSNQIGWSLAAMAPNPNAPTVFMNPEFYRFHENSKMPLMAFSPQAGGFFSGKFSRAFPGGLNNHKPGIAKDYGSDNNFKKLETIQRWASETDHSPNQVALAWLWSHPFPTIPVVGPKNLEQLMDSLKGMELELPKSLVQQLNALDEACFDTTT